jgi:Tfp pilus assembly protein PilN
VTDLNSEIFQKQNIIESYGNLEQNVRNAQRKIQQYQQISQTTNIAEIFPQLSRVTPRDVRLDELVIRDNSVRFSGVTQSQPSLNLLISNLQLSPDFFNVTISNIESGDEQDPGFHFQVQAETERVELRSSTTRERESVNILDRTQGL